LLRLSHRGLDLKAIEHEEGPHARVRGLSVAVDEGMVGHEDKQSAAAFPSIEGYSLRPQNDASAAPPQIPARRDRGRLGTLAPLAHRGISGHAFGVHAMVTMILPL
jgi:hypothetical protein